MLRAQQQERVLWRPERAGDDGAPVVLRLPLSGTEAEEGVPVDDQAWVETRRRLRAFVTARLRPAEAAEDVVQDVLVTMVQNVDGLTDGTRVDAWAYRIARNAIADEYRRRGRHAASLARAGSVTAEHATDPTADEVLAVDLVELSHCLRPLVEALPEPYRDALVLTSWQGFTQTQAAEHAGVSLPGMKSRVQRARGRLREQLLACCEPETGDHGLRGRPTAGRCCSTTTPGSTREVSDP